MNRLEKMSHSGNFAPAAGETRGKVKPEAVDAHYFNPITQAVHNNLKHARVLNFERIPASREIFIVPRRIMR